MDKLLISSKNYDAWIEKQICMQMYVIYKRKTYVRVHKFIFMGNLNFIENSTSNRCLRKIRGLAVGEIRKQFVGSKRNIEKLVEYSKLSPNFDV